MGEWLYYNFAVGSFHTTVTDFIRLKLNFIQTINKKSLLSHRLGDLRDNACVANMLTTTERSFSIFDFFEQKQRLHQYSYYKPAG